MVDRQRWPARASVRTAAVWAVLREELAGRPEGPLDVLDAGGGTGGFAVPLAELGHRVTVVDPSPDSLAALVRRAAEAGVADRVRPEQGDLASLPELAGAGSVDLVLCHSVLEVVDDPAPAVQALAAVLRPGGAASVLVANRTGAVFARALTGHFDDARRALADSAGRWGPRDAAVRRFALEEITQLLASAGLPVAAVHGVRVFADLVAGSLLDTEPGAVDALVALELAASEVPAYRAVATQLHVLARRG
ncbi:MAG: methyltransferase domain-containing protein [Actinomycetota bacterium]|nr:methyltransferase domain-containing protein [Actinomycetota bacterium]